MPSYHICGYIQFWKPQDLVARLWSCATAMIPFFCFCQPLDHYSLATGLPLVSFMMVCISFFHLYSWGCLPWSALFSQCVDSCCFGLLLGLFSFLFCFFFQYITASSFAGFGRSGTESSSWENLSFCSLSGWNTTSFYCYVLIPDEEGNPLSFSGTCWGLWWIFCSLILAG